MKPSKIKEVAYLAIYHVEREYGGGEEGGWWYNSGERQSDKIHAYDVSTDEKYDAVMKLKNRVNRALNSCYEINNRSLSSVLSEGMMTCTSYFNEIPPKNFPEKTPHYE